MKTQVTQKIPNFHDIPRLIFSYFVAELYRAVRSASSLKKCIFRSPYHFVSFTWLIALDYYYLLRHPPKKLKAEMQNRKNARSLVFSYLAHFYDSWDVHNLNFLLNDVNCKINGGVMTKWIFRATTETPTKKNRVAVLPHLPTIKVHGVLLHNWIALNSMDNNLLWPKILTLYLCNTSFRF